MLYILNLIGPISRNAVESTARRLRAYFDGHNVTNIIFDEYNAEVAYQFKKQNMDFAFVGTSKAKNYVYVIRRFLKRIKSDVIHVYGQPVVHGPVGYLLSKLNFRPLICRFNGYLENASLGKLRTIIARKVEEQLLQHSQLVVFNSHKQREDILHLHHLNLNRKFHVIPPGVEPMWFRQASENEIARLRSKIGIKSGVKVLGSCITPRPAKGLEMSFELISYLRKYYNILFIIVGDSPFKTYYQDLASRMGLHKAIYWAGKQPLRSLYLWYSMFDVTVLTSLKESFGMSISESYLCQTPAVAFSSGGPVDQILHGETGFLAPPGDVRELALFVPKILEDEELRRKFGAKGKEHIESKFTLEIAAQKYRELLKSLCA